MEISVIPARYEHIPNMENTWQIQKADEARVFQIIVQPTKQGHLGGTINLKCGQVVRSLQRWDGQRPTIKFLLRYFRRWLINEKMEERRLSKNSKKVRAHATNSVI